MALFRRTDGKPSTLEDDRAMSACVSRAADQWAREFPNLDLDSATDEAHDRYLQLTREELADAGYERWPA